jgi:signal transduction histidine kinase
VPDVEYHQLLTVALTNTERLIRLINDILDISKIAPEPAVECGEVRTGRSTVEVAVTRRTAGTGLGPCHCQRPGSRSTGRRIDVPSVQGQGSTFSFTAPIADPAPLPSSPEVSRRPPQVTPGHQRLAFCSVFCGHAI